MAGRRAELVRPRRATRERPARAEGTTQAVVALDALSDMAVLNARGARSPSHHAQASARGTSPQPNAQTGR
jgi:hypothetical protein